MKINEIFYSLQGEGHYTGTPAVFLRFSGCNMRCPFCDTQHEAYKEMTVEDIIREVSKFPARHMVITGGEPVMQITPELTRALHKEGFFIQIETNGSLPLADGVDIDWITCSPKGNEIHIQYVDELKLLFIDSYLKEYADHMSAPSLRGRAGGEAEYRLQPLDTGNKAENEKNLQDTINYILDHPKWNLSLQTHKIINVQ